jgi:regulator of sigma E protease
MFDITEEVGQLGVMPAYFATVIGVPSSSSLAAQAGLRTFDLITSVNGRETKRWIDLQQAMAEADHRQPLELSYLRPQQTGWAFADVFVNQPGQATLAARTDEATDLGIDKGLLYISYIIDGWPAHTAGMRPGDKIVALDGEPIELWVQFVERINATPEEPHRVTLQRAGEELTVDLRLERRMRNDRYAGEVVDYRPGIGVYRAVIIDDPAPNENRISRAAIAAFHDTGEVIYFMSIGIVRLLQGRVSFQSIGGPIMIFEIAGTAGRQGAHSFLSVLALISVNLGLLNLLPVPVLDGGHLTLLAVEAIRRKPLSMKVRDIVNIVGLALLVVLMVFALKNDIQRYYWERIVSLFTD